MPPISRLRSIATKAFLLNAALLAVIGQIGVAGAGLSVSRDEASAAPHVERSGVNLHHGHDEATCVACRVLTFHGTVAPRAVGTVVIQAVSAVRPSALTLRADSPTLLGNLSRAPPEIA
jgi:hypothetical protein